MADESSKLLIDQPPLQIIPDLAVVVGLNEALVLQQLHYWLKNPLAGEYKLGKKWIYNTYDQWQEQFPFWSERTIQRTFLSLEEQGVVISAQLEKHGEYMKRRKWYRINYAKLDDIEDEIAILKLKRKGKIVDK